MQPLSERHRQMLLNRALTEVQADALALVLDMPAYVVFDGEYNRLVAADQLDTMYGAELAAGECRIVYIAMPGLPPEEQSDVNQIVTHIQSFRRAPVEIVMEKAA